MASKMWLQGPEFLWENDISWPVMPDNNPDILKNDADVKRESVSCTVVVYQVNLFDNLLTRYSTWHRLKKAVAWLLRFRLWLQNRQHVFVSKCLTVPELQEAQIVIVKYLQREYFGDELDVLAAGGRLPKKSTIYDLEPYIDGDGNLRVGGRLTLAPILDQAKHQMIIPRDHHDSMLIVEHVHSNLAGHSGREYVLSLIR